MSEETEAKESSLAQIDCRRGTAIYVAIMVAVEPEGSHDEHWKSGRWGGVEGRDDGPLPRPLCLSERTVHPRW
jgi:hypothetical protein